MKTEKVVLSFVAVLIGLLVAGSAFYFYESTKVISPEGKRLTTQASATPPPGISELTIDAPVDEAVVTSKTLTVRGKTKPDEAVEITTSVDDKIATPTASGDFTTTVTLDDGSNEVFITAIAPNGEEVTKILTVTYSTESF